MREDGKPVRSRRLAAAAGAAALVGACLGSVPAASAQTSQTFTQDGTFTVPDGVTQLTVTAIGAGGGGGGDSVQPGVASWGGGGGGGGAIVQCMLPVSPGQVFTVSVGGHGGR
ncbi:MAG TPA: hypothetical protein VGL02_05655, partial [Streptomyces sp.]